MKNLFSENCKRAIGIVREMIYLIGKNISPVLLFVSLYAIFNLKACYMAAQLIGYISAKITKIHYISPDNLKILLLRPECIILLIILLATYSLIAIFEIAGLMQAYSLSRVNKKATFFGLITASVTACEKCIHPRNWLLILFIIAIFPLTGFVTFSSVTYSLSIPNFVMDFLFANKVYKLLFYIVYTILLFIEVTYIFALNFYVLGEDSFIKACKKSKELIKNHYIETILTVLFMSAAVYFISVSISAILSDILVKIFKLGMISGGYKFVEYIKLSRGFFAAVFAPIFNVAAITALFFKYIKSEKKIKTISKRAFKDDPFKYRKLLGIAIVILLFISVGAVINADVLMDINKEPNVPDIVAHRGDSVRAPENTMPAIQLAALEKVTYVEFDVHITKDGKIFVSHDDNLKRVSGKDVNMHDLTYDEVMELDTGAWFSKEYKGTKFSLFEDVIKYIKTTEMNAHVEVKPTGYQDKKLIHDVVDIIKANDMLDRTMIACLDLDTLLYIEDYAPEVKTLYDMFVGIGDIDMIEKIDAFSVEEDCINEVIVKQIHKTGRPCYVWTVNSEDRVQYFLDCGVDAILTDDPIMMRNALIGCDYSGGILKFLRMYVSSILMGM